MQFKLVKHEIFNILQNAINFTSSKNINTILQNVYISAENGKINIKTNSIISGFCATIDANVESEGETTVVCKKLLDIIKELPDNSIIDFSFDGSRLKIISGKASFSLATMSPEMFPSMTEITPEYTLKLKSADILDIIEKTLFCVANNAAKIEFTGLHFKVYGNKLELHSADFQRIATATITLSDEQSDEFIINIPKKTVSDIYKMLSPEMDVEIYTDLKQLMIVSGNIKVFSRLIEKTVKSISSLFAVETPIEVTVNKNMVLDVLRKVMAIASEITHAVAISISSNSFTMYSLETEYGQGVDKIENIYHKGDDIDIVVNARLLHEILSHIDSNDVIFKITGRRNPISILPGSGNYRYLLVPLAVDRA